MLPNELLVVIKHKNKILPRYAELSDENIKIARKLIEIYCQNVGKKKKNVRSFVNELETEGHHYRFVRGLSLTLDRKCSFKANTEFDPVRLRRKIFCLTGNVGLPTKPEQRRDIIKAAASEMGLTVEMAEEALYADLDEELIIKDFNPPLETDLLKEYNLSLTQTFLFNSTELRFTTSGNWQKIFYETKKLGLIYDVVDEEDKFWVKLDGPASLFKLTRRYGVNLAKLLPSIVKNLKWVIEGKILWKYTNELCSFRIESEEYSSLLKETKLPEISYDSDVEEKFAEQFQALNSNWQLKREPEPIKTGNQVIIPDFSFEMEGIKIYLEILGFWTDEYLKRKIEKLKVAKIDMIIAVNERLACEKIKELEDYSNLKILYYKDKIALAPILRYLEKPFQEMQDEQKKILKNLPVTFTEMIVEYSEFAARVGLATSVVRSVLREEPPKDYVSLPNSLVRKEKIRQIDEKIQEIMRKRDKMSFSETLKIIEDEKIKDASSLIEFLGYKIVWHGINNENAEVINTYKKND